MQTFFVIVLIIGAFVAMGLAFLARYNNYERREFFWAATAWSLWIPALLIREKLTIFTSATLALVIFLVILAMCAYRHRKNSLR